MPNAWDRQRDADGELEPAMWHSRFERYRTQGPERSLLGAYNAWLAEKGGKRRTSAPGSWERAFDKWRWKARAEAWDEHERQRRLKIEAEELEEMYRRHMRLATAMQTVAGRRIASLSEPKENALMSPSDARQYAKDGIEIERTTKGLPREIVQILGMTNDELLAYYRKHYAGEAGTGDGDSAEGAAAPEDDEA